MMDFISLDIASIKLHMFQYDISSYHSRPLFFILLETSSLVVYSLLCILYLDIFQLYYYCVYRYTVCFCLF